MTQNANDTRDLVILGGGLVGMTLALAAAKKGMVIRLAGSEGADVTAGTISASSPMGSALMGKKVGDSVEVETPKGIKKYKIIRIA